MGMMKSKIALAVLLHSLLLIILAGCAAEPSAPRLTSTAIPTPTFAATFTPAPTASPAPTLTATPPPESGYLFTWPVAPPSETQMQAAIACESRNWGKVNNFNPASYRVNHPASACDYAMQAISTVESINLMTLEGEGYSAAQQALKENPWMILSDIVFFNAFHTMEIVAPPPFVHSKLKSAIIGYSWTGDNIPISFELEITTDGPVTATGFYQKIVTTGEGEETESVIQSLKINKEINSQNFFTLGQALDNLLPIPQQTSLSLCENHHPDWIITLTYTDGTEITLNSNQSTYLVGIGGPFQTNIDGQDYLLASIDFHEALYEIIKSLALELGSPEAANCSNIPIADILLGAQP